MRRIRLFFVLVSVLLCGNLSAQYWAEDGYSYYYDYDHRVVVRSCVACEYDYQDLWNGDYVRLINGKVYIYRNGSSVTYGDRVWLEHTGDYTVERGNWQYLMDADGDRTGAAGVTINVLWNGICEIKRGDYWYLYTRSGNRLGGVYSLSHITLYWNGYYCYEPTEGTYRLADRDGDVVSNSYSVEEPDLTNAGYFRVYRGGTSYLIDRDGDRVY